MSTGSGSELVDTAVCSACGHRLLALSYTRAAVDDDATATAARPHLKCPGCGLCSAWQARSPGPR